jgi:ribonuclease E
VQEQSAVSDEEVGAGAADSRESGEPRRRRRRGRRGGRRANRQRNGERAGLPAAGETGVAPSGDVLLAAASVEEEWPDLVGDIASEDETASEHESVEKSADESEWRAEASGPAAGGESAAASGSSAEHHHDRGTASAESDEDDLNKPKRGGWWQRRSFF